MTTEEKTAAVPRTRRGIDAYVARRANELHAGAQKNSGAAVAAFAKLRRAASSEIGEDAAAWQTAFLGFATTDADYPFPTYDEQAVYTALTLYAFHQQSKTQAMHTDGPSLGAALNRLAYAAGSDAPSEPVVRRFNALVTADTVDEVHWHLRSLIGQLRSHGIALDYGMLADDLARLAGRDRTGAGESRRAVQLRWSRDFSRSPRPSDDSPAESTE
ncbi:hypothetical protein nbrc107696_42990 [Gordonia spumicola]|uniref:Type I-E CRISPR-associated protein Cse2/CasB n=1 Tax=Gordonia spumicola TaxID=589161 RepID=A0A7I9VFG2_9ACTN|nr:type I-E CRISPR-associated protein Cse2/CasB [Gordonia spumicola]GEE03853.1 hypothetical protein nbrc107696_42990 [Gordonia spumicola]